MSPSTVDISGRGITLITNRLSNTTTTGWWLTNPPEKYEFVRLDHQFGKKYIMEKHVPNIWTNVPNGMIIPN